MSQHDELSPTEETHFGLAQQLPAPMPATAHIARLTELDLELAPAPSVAHAFSSVRTPAHRAS